MNDKLINRRELKYYINHVDYLYLASLVSNFFQIDKNCKDNGSYSVRSLYFDNKSNKDYFEKISGYDRREKYRIRIYNMDPSPVKFEIKGKTGNIIIKESLEIEPGIIKDIISGNYEPLLKYGSSTARKIYGEFSRDHYRPVVIIDYDRRAYSLPVNNIRITFDSKIRKCEVNPGDIFSDNYDMFPVTNHKKIIMEIKYNGFIPSWIKKMLQVQGFERCAISKYTLSRYMEN
ncbi:MAG: polyphosphate polymerase domain-containing protein [Actinobacteria bacterium]|nr:polyphosphate polymerase domain-containing protein [Actinomycetota bacterium]